MSQLLYLYAHLCWVLDVEHLVGVLQLEVELHLLVEDLVSSVTAEAFEKLYSG